MLAKNRVFQIWTILSVEREKSNQNFFTNEHFQKLVKNEEKRIFTHPYLNLQVIYFSITLPTTTCPEPHPQANWVLSLDQLIENMLPILGFSKLYDHFESLNIKCELILTDVCLKIYSSFVAKA